MSDYQTVMLDLVKFNFLWWDGPTEHTPEEQARSVTQGLVDWLERPRWTVSDHAGMTLVHRVNRFRRQWNEPLLFFLLGGDNSLNEDLRISNLRGDESRYCLPDGDGDFCLDTFMERWVALNKYALLGADIPFQGLRPVCRAYMRIVTMLDGFETDNPHSAQILASVITYVLATEVVKDTDDQDGTTNSICRDTGQSCQDYRQKVTGRTLFDGVASLSALNGDASLQRPQTRNHSEGQRGHEKHHHRRASENLDVTRPAGRIGRSGRGPGRGAAPFGTGHGRDLSGRPGSRGMPHQQKYQWPPLAHQPELPIEPLGARRA